MRYILSFLFVCTLMACKQSAEKMADGPTELEFIGDTIQNDYAEAFRIIQFDDFTQIDLIDPVKDSTLYRYGVGENIPSELVNLGAEIKTVAALSATHVGMLKALNAEDKIIGVSEKRYLCKDILHDEWVNYGELSQADPELFIKHKPTLIMYSGFKLDPPVLEKLKKLGISAMVNFDWKETHPLGRAEWLKVFGYLFKMKTTADSTFAKIKQNYLTLAERVGQHEKRPTVLVGTVYGDVFNAPAGESYLAILLADANVDYVYNETKGTGSLTMGLEEVITENQGTDYWLNAAARSRSEILEMNANFSFLSAYQNKKLYTYFSNVNCFWEESAVAPDKVLSDLIQLFYGNDLASDDLYYYSSIK
jgi:iron complex transport system substrate-binding protein